MTPYRYLPAAGERAMLANIPHTGTWLPDAIRARLASDAMRALPMTDWHLHALYDFLPALGVPVLHATVSRFAGDLNRSPEPMELYPGRVETGVIPVETFWGDAIWLDPPSDAETAEWVERWHRPYHRRLAAELERLRERHGQVLMLDLHSVASWENRIHGELTDDIYLGDRDGSTCSGDVVTAVEEAYRAHGFRVVRNTPYKGGFNTHHYGGLDGVDTLQIEMVQRVYMDEGAPACAQDTPAFDAARQRIKSVFESVLAHGVPH